MSTLPPDATVEFEVAVIDVGGRKVSAIPVAHDFNVEQAALEELSLAVYAVGEE